MDFDGNVLDRRSIEGREAEEAMSSFWEWLAPCVALMATLVAMQAAVAVTGAIRRRDYRLFENKSHEHFARQFPLAAIERSPAEECLKALSLFVETAHKAANAAQTTYHNA